MASLSKSQGKTAKKEARPRSPPEKKSLKASEEMSCVSEQHAPSPPLKGEDIQALAIRSEDLKKLREPQPPSDQQKQAAMMRVLVRKPRPPEESRKGQRVVVARPLAQASTNQPLDYTGPGGPRFDAQGMVLPHSILGSLEDFRREMEARGETELLSRIPDTQRRRPQVVEGQKGAGVRGPSFPAPPPPCAPPPPPSPPQLQRKVQSHALQHWHSHMRQRRRQQDFISNLLQKPVEGLLMNQSNSFRQTQEQRELLSRALPAIHPGHGQRVGSEFWSVPEQFGGELSGVRASLTQSQRGRQQPLTHVAQPASIRHESGNIPVGACDGARRTWEQSVYLKHCRQELRDVLKHLDASQPEMDGLEVIGSGQPFTSVTVERSPLLEEEERGEELRETEQKENHDPLAQFDDVMLVPVLVPALRFCGQRARWTGNGTSHKGEVGLCARVLLEALEGESVSSDLQIYNEGSTAIYYSWQRLPRPCSFPHTHTHTHTQHFYFNTSTGVILPGETQRVEFIFKSERAGVLGEAWRFNTHPVLMGGASLQVILRGVALCQDRTADQRLAIQRELDQRVAVTVCRSLVCDVLRGVRTPERPGSPAELYTTEEEHFLSSNPRLQYQYETVEALKALWQQVAAAGEPWDLSVTTLRQVVLALPQGEEGPEAAQDGLTREGALEHYNSLLLQLARPQHTGRPLPRTSVGVQLWRELLDSLVSQALWLRHTLGLPDPQLHQENWGRLKKEEMKEDKREEKKEEKRGGPPPKEDKKVGSGKEEKKGAHKPAVREKPVEERPPSKKKGRGEEVGRRGEEVGRSPGGKEGREASPTSSSPETCYQDQPAGSPVEPCALEQYRTQLHQQVCVLMEGLVDSLCQLLEEDAEA